MIDFCLSALLDHFRPSLFFAVVRFEQLLLLGDTVGGLFEAVCNAFAVLLEFADMVFSRTVEPLEIIEIKELHGRQAEEGQREADQKKRKHTYLQLLT